MLNQELLAFIEEAGLFYEKTGLPRMCGRIMGLLMTFPEGDTTFNSCVEVLQASKSSISTGLRQLEAMGLIMPYTLPGNRKTFYRLTEQSSYAIIEQRMKLMAFYQKIVTQAARLNQPGKRQEQLREMAEFYDFVQRELPLMYQKWDERRKLKQI